MAPGRPSLVSIHRSLGIPSTYGASRDMPAFREAKHVVLVGRDPNDGKPVRLTLPAARAWRRMRDAATADGVTLLPLSGFRSIARQTRLIRRNLAKGRPMDDLLRYIAAPGYSEHHTGRAIDIGDPTDTTVEESFARTPAYRWLRRRAGEFGFVMTYPRGNRHGIGYEPWHWCWHAQR